MMKNDHNKTHTKIIRRSTSRPAASCNLGCHRRQARPLSSKAKTATGGGQAALWRHCWRTVGALVVPVEGQKVTAVGRDVHEGVDEVRAHPGVHVLGKELADGGPVLGEAAVVAEDLLLRCKGGTTGNVSAEAGWIHTESFCSDWISLFGFFFKLIWVKTRFFRNMNDTRYGFVFRRFYSLRREGCFFCCVFYYKQKLNKLFTKNTHFFWVSWIAMSFFPLFLCF